MLIVWPRATSPERPAEVYAINWNLTRGFLAGNPLYDPNPELLIQRDTFIGPPSNTLLYLPFTFGPFSATLFWYRVTSSALFAFAVVVASATLSQTRRVLGWTVGAVALVLWHPVFVSVFLGQVDAWIVAALAFAVYLAARERWFGVGVCLGVAALIKISPAATLVYCVLERRWRAIGGAATVLLLAVLLTTSFGTFSAWVFFATHVAPDLARGTLDIDNQSLPAVLARTFAQRDGIDAGDPLGPWSLLAPALAVTGTVLVWRVGRVTDCKPFALSLVVLVGLLAGPITWNHYETWALVPLILQVDERLWTPLAVRWRRPLAIFAVVAACLFIIQFSPRPSGPIRVLSQLGTVGLAIQFGLGLSLLRARAKFVGLPRGWP